MEFIYLGNGAQLRDSFVWLCRLIRGFRFLYDEKWETNGARKNLGEIELSVKRTGAILSVPSFFFRLKHIFPFFLKNHLPVLAYAFYFIFLKLSSFFFNHVCYVLQISFVKTAKRLHYLSAEVFVSLVDKHSAGYPIIDPLLSSSTRLHAPDNHSKPYPHW